MFSFFKKKPQPRITLEEQLDSLANLGISLEPEITINDLLHSFAREEYEKKPYDLVLGMLGSDVESEPWERPFSTNIWNCDFERIYNDGDYIEIVNKLSALTGESNLLSNVEDKVDFDNNIAWLKYNINGNDKHYKIVLNNDWIDPDVIDEIILDLERDGKHFFGINCGQATLFLYLDAESASNFKKLTGQKILRWKVQ